MVDTDFLIVGGGLNGSVLALALARTGLSVTVLDAQPIPARAATGFDGRSYAMALTSCRLLRALDLWPALEAEAEPIRDIKVSDGRAGEGPSPLSLHFNSAEIEEGPMGHMIEDRHLRPVLLQALADHPNITHLAPARVMAQQAEAGGVAVTLEDGRVLRGRVLLGADGRQSETGRRAGIKRIAWGYGQTAMVCAIAHEKPHEGVAHQFFMPTGPLAILPLTGNRSSIVWSETAENAAAFHAMDAADYLTMLRPRFGDFLGEISLAGARYTYPLSLSLAQTMVADRVALVGDAAHGVHPIAGQGLNAGMRDIAAIAQAVLEGTFGGQPFDNTTLALATDSFNRLFSNDNALLRMGRDLGLGLVNRLPGLRRGFIREAAGLTGDLPELMRA